MNEMLRRRGMMRAGTPYSDLTYNKAWNSSNGGEHQPGPIDAEGYAITPFLELTWSSGLSVTVKAGYTPPLHHN